MQSSKQNMRAPVLQLISVGLRRTCLRVLLTLTLAQVAPVMCMAAESLRYATALRQLPDAKPSAQHNRVTACHCMCSACAQRCAHLRRLMLVLAPALQVSPGLSGSAVADCSCVLPCAECPALACFQSTSFREHGCAGLLNRCMASS